MMVPYHIGSQSLKKKKPTEPKPVKEARESWGIPLTVISKMGIVRQKLGITNQNQNSEVITNPRQHKKMLKKKNEMMTVSQIQLVNRHPKKSFQTQNGVRGTIN